MSVRKIIKENLNEKLCQVIQKKLDRLFEFKNGINPKFTETIRIKDTPHTYTITVTNKMKYDLLITYMCGRIKETLDFMRDESYECVKNYVDNKLNETTEYIEESEEGESGDKESSGTSNTGSEWESGVTRGPGNPITYNTEWKGQRGWEGIKSYTKQRGKANPL